MHTKHLILIKYMVSINVFKSIYTVRPLLSGHPRDFEKWSLNIEVGLLTEVHYKLYRKGSKHILLPPYSKLL